MTLIFCKKDGEQLMQMDCESNPFVVGDKIAISVNNNNPEKWDIKSEFYYLKIESIEKQITTHYNTHVTNYINIFITGKVTKA